MSDVHPLHAGRELSAWGLLFGRWKLAIALSAGSFVLCCIVIQNLTPIYKAHVELMLPFTAIEDPADRKGTAQTQTDSFVVRSYSEIVKDSGLCQEVIDKLHLKDVNEFKSRPSRLSKEIGWIEGLLNRSGKAVSPVADADFKRSMLIDMYKDRLITKSDTKSLILDLYFEAADPYLATRIVDAHAHAFISSQVNYRRQEAMIKTEWMKAELDRAAEEVRAAQVSIQLHSPQFGLSRDTSANQVAELKFGQMIASSKQAVYEALLAKYQSMYAEQRYVGSEIRILSEAAVPAQPAFPRKILFGAASLVLSVFLGFATATLVAVMRRRETIEEFAAKNSIEIVGYLHILRRKLPLRLGRRARLQKALFWEQVREIRSALNVTKQGTVIAVTSSLPSEGKSLVAAALARSIASSGTRTLLLDMNLRKPSFYVPERTSINLCSYLDGETTISQSSTLVDPTIPLYLLCSSKEKRFRDPDILTGPKMRALIDDVRQEFETIIVDTPAMSIVSDALFVSRLADHVLLTTLDRHHVPKELEQSLSLLKRRGVPLNGLIVAQHRKPISAAYTKLSAYIMGERLCDIWPVVERQRFTWRRTEPNEHSTATGVMAAATSFAQVMARRLPG